MDVKDLKVLSAHGAKIMKDVDTLVNYVNDGNDEKLVKKIHMVKTGLYSHIVTIIACIHKIVLYTLHYNI